MPVDDTITNFAQVYTAAREARAEHPDESRFNVAMRALAAPKEMSDPLFPVKQKLTDLALREQSLNLSTLIQQKEDSLNDAELMRTAAEQFQQLSPEDKVNAPTPAFKTMAAQRQWTNFMQANLATDQVQQVAQMHAADSQYKIAALGMLDPADRTEIASIKDPAIQIRALDMAVQAKRQKAENAAEALRLEALQGKIAVVEATAKGRLDAQKERDRAMEAIAKYKTNQTVSRDKFIQMHLNQLMKDMDTTDPIKVSKWLNDFYDKNFGTGTREPLPMAPATDTPKLAPMNIPTYDPATGKWTTNAATR